MCESNERPIFPRSCNCSVVVFLCLCSLLLQWTDMKNRASPSRSCVTLSSIDFNSLRDVFAERGRNENIFHHLSELHGNNQTLGRGATYTITNMRTFLTHRKRRKKEKKQISQASTMMLVLIFIFRRMMGTTFIENIEF